MLLTDCAACVGIDWADDEHAVCVIDLKTQKMELMSLKQDPEEIAQWVAGLQQQFPGKKIAVCLEQKRGALVYGLLKYDCLTLVPINPHQACSFREAFKNSGAKDDPTDASRLAELLTKHSEHLRGWQPDGALTRKLRFLVEDRRSLVDTRTAMTNRLKSRLKQYFPLALEVCGSSICGNLACQLLLRFPTLEELQEATDDELKDFYKQHHCNKPAAVEERVRLIRHAMPLTTDPAIIESHALFVTAVVNQILALNDAIDEFDSQIGKSMAEHPDSAVFEAFPAAGAAMAPRLLAVLGTDRSRYEDSSEISAQVGIAPVTIKSGKSKVVRRRWACNRFELQTFHEHAGHSIKHSIWAKAYYDMMRDRGKKHQAAVRALAFKWIRIIFRCWKNRTIYDELTYVASLIKSNSPVVKYLAGDEN